MRCPSTFQLYLLRILLNQEILGTWQAKVRAGCRDKGHLFLSDCLVLAQ